MVAKIDALDSLTDRELTGVRERADELAEDGELERRRRLLRRVDRRGVGFRGRCEGHLRGCAALAGGAAAPVREDLRRAALPVADVEAMLPRR